MACDIISYETVDQLMILALAVNLYGIRPIPFPPTEIGENNFQAWLENWITVRLKPYQDIKFRSIDITHLESLSCLKVNTFIGRALNDIFIANGLNKLT